MLPIDDVEKVIEEKIREYYYGICDGFSKTPFTFISKTKNSIPPDAVCINKCIDTSTNIKQFVNVLLYDYLKNEAKIIRLKNNRDKIIKKYINLIKTGKEEDIQNFLYSLYNKGTTKNDIQKNENIIIQEKKVLDKIKVGSVVCHTDGDRNHCGVIVGITSMKKVEVVFCTTNPLWNPYSRELSADEQKLFGFPDRGKTTYFAPVIRSIDEVYYLGYDFPLYRTEDLAAEFFYRKIKKEEETT